MDSVIVKKERLARFDAFRALGFSFDYAVDIVY